MKTWSVTSSMQLPTSGIRQEMWLFKDSAKKKGRRYKVSVSLGKAIDVLSLKSDVLKDFSHQVSHVSSTRSSLYKSGKTVKVDKCPVCGSSTTNSQFRLSVYGGHYCQCLECSHCFVINRPTEAALKEFYSNDTHYASTYTNKRAMKIRIKQVVVPKVEWMIRQFKLLYGKRPKSVLDIGAGSGHFVYACRQLGIKAQGIEPSKPSRKFCRENFGFDLQAIDFMEVEKAAADIITFWGVIEHALNSTDLLKKAYKLLSKKNALVVAEVPRWDSLSSVVQRSCPNSIIRHLEPLGHINCFTDSSLCTAFKVSGFAPVAAWYFGMDSYELFTQLLYLLKDNRNIFNIKKFIASMQDTVDQARLSDTLVLAGKRKT